MEFNYLEKRRAVTRTAKVVTAWEVSAAGYASATARPWDGVKGDVVKVVIDSSFAEAGITNCAYLFSGFSALVQMKGFGVLSGMTDATQLFASCAQLRTVYADSFDNSKIAKYTSMFYGCTALAALDLTGLDPSALTSLTCTFGGCSALRTITVDSDWALPASGVSGSMTFYNCKQLVGGNGTVFSSGKTGYAMMKVDTAAVAGYLTAG